MINLGIFAALAVIVGALFVEYGPTPEPRNVVVTYFWVLKNEK